MLQESVDQLWLTVTSVFPTFDLKEKHVLENTEGIKPYERLHMENSFTGTIEAMFIHAQFQFFICQPPIFTHGYGRIGPGLDKMPGIFQ